MRSFVIAILLFIAVVASVLTNSVYVRSFSQEISTLCEKAANSEQTEASINEIQNLSSSLVFMLISSMARLFSQRF